MKNLIAMAAVVVAMFPAPVLAQSLSGQWACQVTYTQYDQYGNRTGGHVQDFMMMLYPNGSYEAQGTTTSVAGYHQFQSQGTWQDRGNGIFAQGEMYDTMSPTPGLFGVVGQLMPDGTLMYTEEMPDGTMSTMLSRTNVYCEPRN